MSKVRPAKKQGNPLKRVTLRGFGLNIQLLSTALPTQSGNNPLAQTNFWF